MRAERCDFGAALAAGLCVACALPAGAAEPPALDAARAAYSEGRFVEAAELAAALETVEGYVLAAEALAIYGHYVAAADAKKPAFDRAVQWAREAIRRAPRHPEAHLQLAHALGRYVQTLATADVLAGGYPKKLRGILETALQLAPEMAAAHVSLASWHAEARSQGGIMAGVLFGASAEQARTHYARALELAGDEPIMRIEYALGLLALDRRAHRAQARALLRQALDMPARNAYDRILHEQAAAQLAELDAPPPPSRHPGRLGQ